MLTEKFTPTAYTGEGQSSPCLAAASAAVQCWSTTNERFDAESLSNLVIANDWLRAGDVVYVADRKPIVLSDLCDADDVVIIMSQRAMKLRGDDADGYPGATPQEKAILTAAISGWIAMVCPPNFFGVDNIRRHTVTDADLDAAARAVIGAAQ